MGHFLHAFLNNAQEEKSHACPKMCLMYEMLGSGNMPHCYSVLSRLTTVNAFGQKIDGRKFYQWLLVYDTQNPTFTFQRQGTSYHCDSIRMPELHGNESVESC